MSTWKKLSSSEIKERIFRALGENVNFYDQHVIGVPASHLDSKVFYRDAPFIKDLPFLSTLVHNPNHIGCHTLGNSESFFAGTQEIEKELIGMCARDILKCTEEFDGYVASGGTEANMQAIWIYRNYYTATYNARREEIAVLCSADSHYSMAKACNVLCLDLLKVAVDPLDRKVSRDDLYERIRQAVKDGKRYIIVVANMMTTMFGSVDDPDLYASALEEAGLTYKIHVDGAFGGFYYPFADKGTMLSFGNPRINSVTLDAHKMVQAPYGTGIFLIRKNYMRHANTSEASYVEGEDYTLIGSRSGANAVAIWMILMTYGPYGWGEKILLLMNRADWLCRELEAKGIAYFREAGSNIVTIRQEHVMPATAKKFGLVPDSHGAPSWYKIVIMEHVTVEKLLPLLDELV